MNQTSAFIRKLAELREQARKNGNALTKEEVDRFLSEAGLSGDQMKPVLQYLLEEGIAVMPEASGEAGDGGAVTASGGTGDGGAATASGKAGDGGATTASGEAGDGEADGVEAAKASGKAGAGAAGEPGAWDTDDSSEDFLAGYLEQIRQMPKLEPKEELSLFLRTAQGDTDARDMLASAYLEVVCDLAAEYQEEIIPAEELIAEGNLGLLTALGSFEAEDSLAACQALLLNALNEHMKSAAERLREEKRSDNAFVSRARHLDEARKTLEEELEHEVSPQELSAFLDLPLEEIEDVLRLSRKG